MKNLSRTFIIALFLFLIIPDNLFSQGPPPWAPAHGYRAKTRYVYFPDRNFYYDLNTRNYIYLSGSNWRVSATLPKLLIGINLGKSTQIELDFVGERPYRENHVHVVKYKKPKKVKAHRHHRHHDNHDHDHDDHGRGNGHGRGHGRH